MKCLILNEQNLRKEEMEETVTRLKTFVINEQNEILLASANGGVQLIGGHVEEGEDDMTTIQREILEETGIEIVPEEISGPFYEIQHYVPNYFHSGKNVIARIVYYYIHTNKKVNEKNAHLTEREEECAFHVQKIPMQEFESYVSSFLNNEQEINRLIAEETLRAFHELQDTLFQK